ncbi:hypothetical protein ACHAWF_010412 [Thalassiosira exigua]
MSPVLPRHPRHATLSPTPKSSEKMLNSFRIIARKATLEGPGRTGIQRANFSSNIVRLGTDVLPPMSQAVVHNGIVYLSGQIDGTADDVVGKSDGGRGRLRLSARVRTAQTTPAVFSGQTKNVLAKVDRYLAEAGTDKSKLLTSTVWLKDIERDFGAMNEVWNAWIDPDNKPVRATTEASLAAPKLLVEVQVTAALD